VNERGVWFDVFGRDVLKEAVWRSKAGLVRHVMKNIRSYSSAGGKPLAWTCTGTPPAAGIMLIAERG